MSATPATISDRVCERLAGRPDLIRIQMDEHNRIVSGMQAEINDVRSQLFKANYENGILREELSRRVELQRESWIDTLTAVFESIDNVLIEVSTFKYDCPRCGQFSDPLGMAGHPKPDDVRLICGACRNTFFHAEHRHAVSLTVPLEVAIFNPNLLTSQQLATLLVNYLTGVIPPVLRCGECKELRTECRCDDPPAQSAKEMLMYRGKR
jgi:ribosomal protein S27AE